MTQPPSKDPNRSRRELASELVHDILKDKLAERRQERSKRPGSDSSAAARLRRFRLALAILFPLFLGLLAWNLTAGRKPPVVFTPAEVDAGARFKIFLAVQALKAYRDSAGHWPTSLRQVGFGDEGMTYEQVDTSYVITAVSGGTAFTYRGGEDLSFFRDAPRELTR